MSQYICKHFQIHELVPKSVYMDRGEKAWELFDPNALRTIDMLLDRYGSITINNWFWGGDREWSGLRIFGCPYFSPYSQHTFGRAFDNIFKEVTAEEVRQDIINNPDDPTFRYIRAIELNTSWLHTDTRNCCRLKTFNS
jgi:hypothetical protein